MTHTNHKTIIGIMGPGTASQNILDSAYELGRLIALENFVVLTGGRNAGVMDAALKGAKSVGGLTLGILTGNNLDNMSLYVDIPITTDLGSGRNNVNVLTSRVIVACGIGAGTASEVALALKANKHVILLNNPLESHSFFKSLSQDKVWVADTPSDAISLIKSILSNI